MPFRKTANALGLVAAFFTFNSLGHAEPHLPPHGLIGYSHSTGQAVVVFPTNQATTVNYTEGSDRWTTPLPWSHTRRTHSQTATFHLFAIRVGIQMSNLRRYESEREFNLTQAGIIRKNINLLADMMLNYADPRLALPPWLAWMEDLDTMVKATTALYACAKVGVIAPSELPQAPIAVSCEHRANSPSGLSMELHLTRPDGLVVAYAAPMVAIGEGLLSALPPPSP